MRRRRTTPLSMVGVDGVIQIGIHSHRGLPLPPLASQTGCLSLLYWWWGAAAVSLGWL